MNAPVGTCSLCGGTVVGYAGSWLATVPPPLPHCTRCGAVADPGPVIPMQLPRWPESPRETHGTSPYTGPEIRYTNSAAPHVAD